MIHAAKVGRKQLKSQQEQYSVTTFVKLEKA